MTQHMSKPTRRGQDDIEVRARFLNAAGKEAITILRRILNNGGYDDDGDFILYHREGATPEDDYRDAVPLADARVLLAAIDKRRPGSLRHVKCTQRTYPGCGCKSYHLDSEG